MKIFSVLFAVSVHHHVVKHWYITLSINKWARTWKAMALFDNCVFVYSCSHLSLSACGVASMFCIFTNTNTPCQCSVGKTNWSVLYKKSLPGASHFEIKSMSLCSALVPGMRERTWECVARRREERWASVVIFTARESHRAFYLFPSIRRQPAGKVGGLD